MCLLGLHTTEELSNLANTRKYTEYLLRVYTH